MEILVTIRMSVSVIPRRWLESSEIIQEAGPEQLLNEECHVSQLRVLEIDRTDSWQPRVDSP